MITGCDLNTSLEDMERLTALTPYVLAAVGSPVDASAAGDPAADTVFKRLQQRISDAPSEWSLDYVEHHQMMEKVA